jgi:Flp pilus assembly protein TadD
MHIVKARLATIVISLIFVHGSLASEGSLLEDTIRSLQRRLEEHPDDPKLLLDLAVFQNSARQKEQALKSAQRALEHAPNDAGFFCTLSGIFSSIGRTQQAIDLLLRAIELNPNQEDYHFNVAILYMMLHPPNRKEAKAHYLKALALGGEPDAKMEKLLE